jgi:restriction system protein
MAMSSLSAAEKVLKSAGKPLHYREITRRMLDLGLWTTEGKTPEATVNARLAGDIKHNVQNSIFRRLDRGIFGLREWASEETPTTIETIDQQNLLAKKAEVKKLSFTDSAEKVLEEFGNKQPMYYRAITEKAMELRLLATEGKTPEATMYAQILTEIRRYQKRGDQPRFVMHGKGMSASLVGWAAGLHSRLNNITKGCARLYINTFYQSPLLILRN